MTNKHMERYSTSLVTKQMHTKTAMQYHLTQAWRAKSKRTENAGEELEKSISQIVSWSINVTTTSEIKVNIHLPYGQLIPHLDILSTRNEIHAHKKNLYKKSLLHNWKSEQPRRSTNRKKT